MNTTTMQTSGDRVHVTSLKVALYGAAFAASLAGAIAASSPWILALLLVPDVALLSSLGSLSSGMLDRRAVRVYNAVHHLPTAVAVSAAGIVVPAVLPFGLIWLAHITMDRTLGFGPRSADGSQRGF